MFWSSVSFIQGVNQKWLFYNLDGTQTLSPARVKRESSNCCAKRYGDTMVIIQRRTNLWWCSLLQQSIALSPNTVTSSATKMAMVNMLAVKFNAAKTGCASSFQSACLPFIFPSCCTTQYTQTEFQWRNCSCQEHSNAIRWHFAELCLMCVHCVAI